MTRQWVNGPGFVKWLERVRPEEMRKAGRDGQAPGGRSAWANEAIVRALYAAEHESRSLSLKVADGICVKLFLHIDSEMPEDLWATRSRGRPPHPKTDEANRLLSEGMSIMKVARATGMCRSSVANLRAKHPAFQGLEYRDGKRPGWVREAA